MQIWAIEWEGDQFKMKVIYNGSSLESWQEFYMLTISSMNTNSKAELWLVEESINKEFETKAKFKWEKH